MGRSRVEAVKMADKTAKYRTEIQQVSWLELSGNSSIELALRKRGLRWKYIRQNESSRLDAEVYPDISTDDVRLWRDCRGFSRDHWHD